MDHKEYLIEKVNSKNYKIYVDLDGVLVNFKTALENIGISIKELEDNPKAVWPRVIKAGENFWSHAPWMKDGKELWNYVKKYDPDILSSPLNTNASKNGKRIWVKNEISPNVKVILCKKSEKQDHADEHSILIDDFERNIEQWRSKGGIGILHKNTKSTIAELKKLGL